MGQLQSQTTAAVALKNIQQYFSFCCSKQLSTMELESSIERFESSKKVLLLVFLGTLCPLSMFFHISKVESLWKCQQAEPGTSSGFFVWVWLAVKSAVRIYGINLGTKRQVIVPQWYWVLHSKISIFTSKCKHVWIKISEEVSPHAWHVASILNIAMRWKRRLHQCRDFHCSCSSYFTATIWI